jgi:2-polyprenyl-3-methyl-5-hydroxy-6-metoxy-1,4-benzoquinol methylase
MPILNSGEVMVCTTTNRGLHEYVGQNVLSQFARSGIKAADLGAGPGAMTVRLRSMGCDVVAADRSVQGFEADSPHFVIDFNRSNFAEALGLHEFDIVTAIEVIEHVESPIGFLRNIGNLLAPNGVAVLTTPNVDSLPARVRFLLAGKIRTMDENGEPTHISPVFFDLLKRQFLPLAGLHLHQHLLFPPDGFQLSRKSVAWSMRLAASLFSAESILGDNHIFVLKAGA